MHINKLPKWLGLTALFLAFGGSFTQPTASLAADKQVKVHIFYTSDAVGYYDPCG